VRFPPRSRASGTDAADYAANAVKIAVKTPSVTGRGRREGPEDAAQNNARRGQGPPGAPMQHGESRRIAANCEDQNSRLRIRFSAIRTDEDICCSIYGDPSLRADGFDVTAIFASPRGSYRDPDGGRGRASGLARGNSGSLLKYWNTFRQRTKERKTVVIGGR